ncbi:MAG: hypothetical protein IKL10_11595 [Clostridia bacterium]|nr:hypothetical protein [Clostridia bacterium]
MSYCVNCGVELDSSAKKCALCSTPVINPNIVSVESDSTPFSETLQIPKSVKKRFIAFVISVTMLIPNIVMFFLNVFFIRSGFWSVYVLAASLLIWVLFVFPAFTKKTHPYLLWGFDTLAAAGFFYTVFRLHGTQIWILKSILCVTALVSLSVLLLIIWSRRKNRHWTAVTVLVLLESTVVSFLSGLLVTLFSQNHSFLVVGIVIACCTFVLMCFFIYCNKSRNVRAWLNKAFFI